MEHGPDPRDVGDDGELISERVSRQPEWMIRSETARLDEEVEQLADTRPGPATEIEHAGDIGLECEPPRSDDVVDVDKIPHSVN